MLVDLSLNSALPTALACGPERVLLYNDAFAVLLGSKHPDIFAGPAEGVFPEALSDRGLVSDQLRAGEKLVLLNRPWVFERDGKLRTEHYNVYFAPVQDEGGGFQFCHATVVPVERPQAVGAGSPPWDIASNSWAASSGDSADAILILDLGRMRLEYASPGLERLLAGDRAACAADFHKWLALVTPEDRPQVETLLSRAKAGEAATGRYRINRPGDGRLVSLRHASFPMPAAEAGTPRAVALVQDVTALELSTEALRQAEEHYRSIIEGIPNLVWRSCNEGLWTWASPQWLAYTGQTQEQSHGWGWLDVVHPDDQQATMEAWHAARPHGELDVSHRIRRASDGAWRWCQTRSTPRRVSAQEDGADGVIIEWIGTTTDIDDVTRLQARQAALASTLEQRTSSMGIVIRSLTGQSVGVPG